MSKLCRYAWVVPRNTPVPCKKKSEFTTVYDYQEEIDVRIFEGERANCDGNHLLGEFQITGREGYISYFTGSLLLSRVLCHVSYLTYGISRCVFSFFYPLTRESFWFGLAWTAMIQYTIYIHPSEANASSSW